MGAIFEKHRTKSNIVDVQPELKSFIEKFKFQIIDYKILVKSRSIFPICGLTHKLNHLITKIP
jgi:hypothetical protein